MLFPNGPEYETSNIELLDQPKIKITYHDAYDTDAGNQQFSMPLGNYAPYIINCTLNME